MSGPVTVEAIVLATLRYGETSRIARLATREHGVLSALAKGALRPRSRFGATLLPLSLGQGLLHFSRRSDLHLLTAFDLAHYPAGLGVSLERWIPALGLAEVMLRFAPATQHAEAFDLLREAVLDLEHAPPAEAGARGIHWLWRLIGELGFTPAFETCVVDGSPVRAEGPLAFSIVEGGALCAACARAGGATWIPAEDREALARLVGGNGELPVLDRPHEAAHRRLLVRYVRAQLGEDVPLHALDFWQSRRTPES